MTCERVEEQLSALIDSELDAETEREVTSHLAGCRNCAETYRELSLLVATSIELEPVNPPDRVYSAIRARLRNAETRRSWLPPIRSLAGRWNLGWVLVPAAATVLLMLILVPHRQPGTTVALEQPVRAPAVETLLARAAVPPPPATHSGRAAAGSRESRVARRASSPPTVSYAVEVTPAVNTGEGEYVIEASSPLAQAVSYEEQPNARSAGTSSNVVANLQEIQQTLEEIEAALYANPGNPQVLNAYRATWKKGQQLKDQYLLGAR